MKKITGVTLLILTMTLTGCFKKKLAEGCFVSSVINTADRAHPSDMVICQEKEYLMSESCLNLGCRFSSEPPVSTVVGEYKDHYGNLAFLLCEKIGGKVGFYEYQVKGQWNTGIFCANAKNEFVQMSYLEDRWQGYLSGICHQDKKKSKF